MKRITQAAVIGAGTMGSGIAAHIANVGVPVTLLDLDDFAHAALERMKTSDRSPLVTKSAAYRIRTGNLERDLELVASADWIIEAVVEDLDVKRGLYRRLADVRKPASIVSSNTSTIPISELLVGAPDSLVPDFAVTHFFNPPRTMRLLELAAGAETRPDVVERLTQFADLALGKTVVHCKDTPAFIANRLGCFWLSCAIAEAVRLGLTVEEADAVMSRPLGIPKTGVFGLMDLVGIPLYTHITASLDRLLPADDPWRAVAHQTELFEQMVAKGLGGRAAGAGFYRRDRTGNQALDLSTLGYRPQEEVTMLDGGLRAIVERPDSYGEYAWAVASKTLAYAAWLVPTVSDSVSQVDLAMQLGFGWKRGPFAMIDELGASWLAERLAADGAPSPEPLTWAVKSGGFYHDWDGAIRELAPDGSVRRIPTPAGALLLRDLKRGTKPLETSEAGSVWDLGDGVACLELHTKLNVLDLPTFELLRQALGLVAARFEALVLYTDADHFSAGANLNRMHALAAAHDVDGIEQFLRAGQQAFELLKRAPFPVVGAPVGVCLGGGCEILLHCDAIQAHTETTMGLVETRVGIVPGWGGCKEMLLRAFDDPPAGGPLPPVRKVFELIAPATTSNSADHARELGFLRAHDRVTRNRDRLLADAKALALALVDGYVPPEPRTLSLPGPAGYATLALELEQGVLRGAFGENDSRVAGELARVLSGGSADVLDQLTEDDLLALERASNQALLATPETLARIERMLGGRR